MYANKTLKARENLQKLRKYQHIQLEIDDNFPIKEIHKQDHIWLESQKLVLKIILNK